LIDTTDSKIQNPKNQRIQIREKANPNPEKTKTKSKSPRNQNQESWKNRDQDPVKPRKTESVIKQNDPI
jgi:hypothetical protein